jgi:aerobic carbon-monoxide dehydrogenase small subunit
LHFTLNGSRVESAAPPMARLLDVLREEFRLTGTKEGCGEGECGACTVLIGGSPVCACIVPLAHAAGEEVTTIEGLGGNHPLQHAFAALGGAQCGICTPGMIMAATALPPKPALEDVRLGLAGNLCRCTGYEAIYRAVLRAAEGDATGRARGGGSPAGGTADDGTEVQTLGGGA